VSSFLTAHQHIIGHFSAMLELMALTTTVICRHLTAPTTERMSLIRAVLSYQQAGCWYSPPDETTVHCLAHIISHYAYDNNNILNPYLIASISYLMY